MKKFNKKKMELLAGVRAEINYQVGLKVNIVLQELNRLKEVVRIDMKKWSTQRADMQLDISHLEAFITEHLGYTKSNLQNRYNM